jgi:hypothetical protein
MNKPHIALSRVIATLKQEGLRWKACAEDIMPTTVSSTKIKSSSAPANQGGAPKRCTFCNVDSHNLNTCFNIARILCKAKARQHQGAKGQQESAPSNKKKGTQKPTKPAAKAGRTSVAQLGQSTPDDNDNTNYSGSEIGVVTHQAVCFLSYSTINLQASGDLDLDSGCSMTMLPDFSSLTHLKEDNTPVQLANQSTIKATKRGLVSLPLSVKALVVPSLHKSLLWPDCVIKGYMSGSQRMVTTS